jgi:putative lipoic acid-binding regulatory protein/uncharacterized RDD family membrane protein YckC
MSEKQVANKRTSIFLRLFALFLDYGIVAGLAATLMFFIDFLFESTLGSLGIKLSPAVVSIPLIVLYFTYFSTEIFNAKSLGKQLLKIEIRHINGEESPEQALLNRFAIKHVGIFIVFLSISFNSQVLQLVATFIFVAYIISVLTALGGEKLSIHDRITELSVFSCKELKTDLSQISTGKSSKELALDLSTMRRERKAKGQTKRAKTPHPKSFPCALELKIYAHEHETMENVIFNCFAEFIPNVHPNQVQRSKHKYGSYDIFKVVMRFENHLQMEASYEALALVPEIVTTTTIKSVKVGAQGKKPLSAQMSLG